MKRLMFFLPAVLVIGVVGLSSSCGGGSKSPTGPASPTPTATATPTPTPTPTATPDPQADLAPGPVTRVTLYIYQQYHGGKPEQGGTIEQKTLDGQGRWVLHVNDFVVFDSTQKNASGEICRYSRPPTYELDDPSRIINVLGNSGNPFLYRVEVRGTGEAKLVSTVDGVAAEVRVVSGS